MRADPRRAPEKLVGKGEMRIMGDEVPALLLEEQRESQASQGC